MRSVFRRCAALALASSAAGVVLLYPAGLGRQDLSALYQVGPAGHALFPVELAAGSRVSSNGEITPILAQGIRRLDGYAVLHDEDGAVIGSLPRGDTLDPAGIRVRREGRGDALPRPRPTPPTDEQEAAQAWFSLAFSYSDLDARADGFTRAMPAIHSRLVFASNPPPPPPELTLATVEAAPVPPERPETREEAFDRLARLSIRSTDELERAHHCLSEAIYFESRGESERGQQAVAQVVLNRVQSGRYPTTVCDVIYQNRHRRNACQFSYACDRRPETVRDERAWEIASRIADDAISGRVFLSEIGDSTHYHANYVHPRWRRALFRTEQIGTHIFYRMPGVSINGS